MCSWAGRQSHSGEKAAFTMPRWCSFFTLVSSAVIMPSPHVSFFHEARKARAYKFKLCTSTRRRDPTNCLFRSSSFALYNLILVHACVNSRKSPGSYVAARMFVCLLDAWTPGRPLRHIWHVDRVGPHPTGSSVRILHQTTKAKPTELGYAWMVDTDSHQHCLTVHVSFDSHGLLETAGWSIVST